MRGRYQRGAMRGVFWLLAMAAMAVALALLMGDNDATVTLFWSPYRFDASFNLVLVLLLAGFVLLYLGLRGFAALRDIPQRARRWRNRQIERAAVTGVLDALAYQLAGRFVRAHTAAGEALRHLNELTDEPAGLRVGQMRLLAHLLAAESAQALQNRGARDDHLGVALQSSLAKVAPDAHEGALLRAIRWAIEDRNPSLARSRLQDLPQGAGRRIQALRLRLRVARLDGAVAEALEVTRLLTKHRAFSAEAGRSLLRGLALDALRQAQDFSQLQSIWQKLTGSEKAMPELVLAGAQRANELLAMNQDVLAVDTQEAAQEVLGWMEPIWPQVAEMDDDSLLRLVRVLEPAMAHVDWPWLSRIEQAQQEAPGNPYWQYLVGQACLQRRLWGKAALLLGQASHGLRDPGLLRHTWRSLAQLAEERGDSAAAASAWQRAARID
ncbi:MAG: heme biosynthesis HemY N-terminal domain-containing protein [Gammaproteobacteria bacterium]